MQEKNKKNFTALGKRLRFFRVQAKTSQAKLADKLGFAAPVVISRFERGQRLPSAETLIKLADLYDVDLHWLITGKPSPGTAKAVRVLKPFVYGHLSEINQKIQTLETERRKLQGRGASTRHTLCIDKSLSLDKIQDAQRLEEIEDELESGHIYYKAVMDALNKVLKPLGEKL